jgi:hypothetical protein
MSQQPTDKKIIVDEDWKAQAQQEKETLSAKLEQEATQRRAVSPEASFEVLLSSLATPAMISLGLITIPNKQPNLEEARFYIDLLEILEKKTKGNLENRESNALTSILYELRMAYVAATRNPAGASSPQPGSSGRVAPS